MVGSQEVGFGGLFGRGIVMGIVGYGRKSVW